MKSGLLHSLHTPDQVFDVAMKALDWLEANPKHWTSGVYARKKDGGHCNPHDSEAVCWCALGRIAHDIDVFETELRAYLEPINVCPTQIVARNDDKDRSIDKIRDFITRQYADKKAGLS